jgi:carboxynorspermidine decarboxylase
VAAAAAEVAETPAFVYDEGTLAAAAAALARLAREAGCRALYTLKPLNLPDVLRLLAPHVDGFSASSLFEATLARDAIGRGGTVHLTTPGLRGEEMGALADVCDYIAFNSLGQWSRLSGAAAGRASFGLRVNPELSFIEDERYDPCRRHSKLGVPLAQLAAAAESDAGTLAGLRGLHFHTNCDSGAFAPLLATVRRIEQRLRGLLERLEWMNLGGGYLYGSAADEECLAEAVSLLRGRYGLEVFVEPGAAVARGAACLVASVIDLFDSGGKAVAVLDTTVNHVPEAFEYQWSPPVAGASPGGAHRYVLAGCTCLAGDLFGEYAFDAPLELGSRVVFPQAGAYTTVKWHWFNGVRLPSLYARDAAGRTVLKKRFTYDDFLLLSGETQLCDSTSRK